MSNLGDESIAHVSEDGRYHYVDEHLVSTARIAAEFAAQFGSAQWGCLAGLWHDLGKFSPDFQKKIRGANLKADHSTAGAIYAVEKFGFIGRILLTSWPDTMPDCLIGRPILQGFRLYHTDFPTQIF